MCLTGVTLDILFGSCRPSVLTSHTGAEGRLAALHANDVDVRDVSSNISGELIHTALKAGRRPKVSITGEERVRVLRSGDGVTFTERESEGGSEEASYANIVPVTRIKDL